MEPWLSQLTSGHPEVAWDLFLERYRRLILATIRRLIEERDDVMDVFSRVCEALSADQLARLRRFSDQHVRRASFPTWLVVVVRNLTLDWLRERDGRRRLTVPSNLSPIQSAIYSAVWVEGRSHVEAYETLRARGGLALQFHEFLREVRVTSLLAPRRPGQLRRRPVQATLPDDVVSPEPNPVETVESSRRIGSLMGSLPADLRVAVELFVVDQMAAADVAQVVGWPNAKAVYNKVYRALATLRAELERKGIGPGDL